MEIAKFYVLPQLPYGYGDLRPYMSEEQLRIHHTVHHQAYVNGANAILKRLDASRKDNVDIDVKAVLKELSWNVGGHLLHSLFWKNLAPPGKGGGKPGGKLANLIDSEFGSFERFRKEFTQAALTVEGSGWAALTICRQTGRLMIMQIEKHNINVYPTFPILMVLDVFEHAYYIDYKNRRADFVEAFWNIVDWDEVDKRLEEHLY
ncbi:MAG: superoxide dismutase [Candidatus Nezhaarchaeota archaeon]|nr:superoxide dismutase [Candidatus Nezhaarchaeota archaeon]